MPTQAESQEHSLQFNVQVQLYWTNTTTLYMLTMGLE